jgi:transcription elongation factor Elf1
MGKRKSSSKPAAKKRADPLGEFYISLENDQADQSATSFKCVFCHRDRSVSVKMYVPLSSSDGGQADRRDKQEMYGHLTCKECGQRFSSPINSRSLLEFVSATDG